MSQYPPFDSSDPHAPYFVPRPDPITHPPLSHAAGNTFAFSDEMKAMIVEQRQQPEPGHYNQRFAGYPPAIAGCVPTDSAWRSIEFHNGSGYRPGGQLQHLYGAEPMTHESFPDHLMIEKQKTLSQTSYPYSAEDNIPESSYGTTVSTQEEVATLEQDIDYQILPELRDDEMGPDGDGILQSDGSGTFADMSANEMVGDLFIDVDRMSTPNGFKGDLENWREQTAPLKEQGSGDGLVCTFRGCGKRSKTASGLRHHQKNHDKPFVCSWSNCGRRCADKKDLERHRRVHGPKRDFFCPKETCLYHRKGMKREDNLNRHIKTQHSKDGQL